VVALALVAGSCGDNAADPVATLPPVGPLSSTPATTTATTPPATTAVEVPVVIARSDAAYVSAVIDATQLADLLAGNMEFALTLLRACAAGRDNLILSPHSIAGALTMAYAGANGETAAQIEKALAVTLSGPGLHDARNALDHLIKQPARTTPDDDREPLRLNIVNALWGQRGFGFKSDFLDVLSRSYDAGIRLADFQTDPAEATRQINDWAAIETGGRIEDLVPQGALTTETRVVLTNAIWFKANWLSRFDPSRTRDGEFHLQNGSSTLVSMMGGGGRMQFASGDGFVAVRLAYAGEASMLIIVPEQQRYNEILETLDRAALLDIVAELSTHQVDLTIPQFSFESELSLVPVLKNLGIVDAFSYPPADFSGMSITQDDLFVQDVLHKAFISVDEEGTEAAAATAVVMGITSVAPPATLTIDRPFIFLIQHDPTGEILFAGQVADPS
jgi:serpin B